MRTDFLFVQPSLLRGVGRSFDLWGQLNQYNTSATPADADILALRSDWEVVAQDFRNGLKAASNSPDQASLFAK